MYPDSPILQKAVWQALRAALALTESDASAHILRAYTDHPPPEPPPSETICYYHLQSSPPSSILEETSLSRSTLYTSVFIPCSLILVFYGPDSETWALRCQSFLFLDGHGYPRRILREAGLYLIPSHPTPSILFEDTGKTRRKRADLEIPARLLSNDPYSPASSPEEPVVVPTVTRPPAVSVHVSRKEPMPHADPE